MKKQKKQLITMIAFFVFLIVAYLSLHIYNEQKIKEKEKASTVVLTSFDYTDVVTFSYMYNDETYSFTKSENVWTFDKKTSIDLDEALVEELLVGVENVHAADYYSEYEAIENYGLDMPQQTIGITLSDGSTIKLQIGDYNEITGYYYLLMEGDSNLYLVDSTLLDTFAVPYTSLEYVEEETEEVDSTESEAAE